MKAGGRLEAGALRPGSQAGGRRSGRAAVLGEYRESFIDRKLTTSSEHPFSSASFKSRYVTSMGITQIDPLYDEMLIGIRAIGGTVSEIEMERLQQSGYGGNLEQRLHELLPDGPAGK